MTEIYVPVIEENSFSKNQICYKIRTSHLILIVCLGRFWMNTNYRCGGILLTVKYYICKNRPHSVILPEKTLSVFIIKNKIV